MALYTTIYKCRLCGKTFSNSATTGREIAIRETMLLCFGGKSGDPQAPTMTHPHFCNNYETGNIGIADFVGFIEENENPSVPTKRCGNCDKTDGICYTSHPPKVKCSITNEFHYYDDFCNVQEKNNG